VEIHHCSTVCLHNVDRDNFAPTFIKELVYIGFDLNSSGSRKVHAMGCCEDSN